jgi:predicted nuclease with TOPRIM domain
LSKLSDEALAKQVANQQAIRDRILETGVTVENSAQSFNKLREAGLKFEGGNITGSTQEYLAALEEVGDLTGQGKAALASYKNAVRATALQIVKSGEGSEDFTRAVAKLGDRIATASPEDLAAEIGALEDITDE